MKFCGDFVFFLHKYIGNPPLLQIQIVNSHNFDFEHNFDIGNVKMYSGEKTSSKFDI